MTCADQVYLTQFKEISKEYGCESLCHTPHTGYFQKVRVRLQLKLVIVILLAEFNAYPYPICTTAEEYICAKVVSTRFSSVVGELCDMPCTTQKFSGPVMKRRSNQTVISMTYPSLTVKTQATNKFYILAEYTASHDFPQSEYYVQTLGGIVGEVGGSLGLFLGFSIWQCGLFCVKRAAESCKRAGN